MFDVLGFKENVNRERLGVVTVRYYDLVIDCDVCLYQRQKLWIRTPEKWVSKTKKVRYISWATKELSDQFQEAVLRNLFNFIGMDVALAVKMLDDKKHLTKQKNKITLG